MKIAVLGTGAWGTALASVLLNNGLEVSLWAYEQEVVDDIKDTNQNKRYLPGITLKSTVHISSDMQQVVTGATYIIEAIPVVFLRSTIERYKACFKLDQKWIVTSKGIEQKTIMLPHEIVNALFESNVCKAALVGPSFALEVGQKALTGMVVASTDADIAQQVIKLFANDFLKVEHSTDLIGVQMAAAFKNVIAIGMGMLQGSHVADNTVAFFFTRALQETMQLGVACGGQVETYYSLAGVGDMLLTSMGNLSRNVAIGYAIAQGKSFDVLLQGKGIAPEGINTLRAVPELIKQKNVAMPICYAMHQVIFGGKPIQSMLETL